MDPEGGVSASRIPGGRGADLRPPRQAPMVTGLVRARSHVSSVMREPWQPVGAMADI
jgi:hypothetical protein